MVDAYGRAGADRDVMARLAGYVANADTQIGAGNHDSGIAQLKQVFDFGPQMVFNMDLFQQNLRTAFNTTTVGYAYAIAQDGKQVLPSAQNPMWNGSSRRDLPVANQSPTKEMNIASVSKTLTAVAVLRLLESRGLSIDSPIDPWLPPLWTRGPGVTSGLGGLTFEDVMKHKSGLNNNDGSRSYDYASLRSAIAAGDQRVHETSHTKMPTSRSSG